MLLLMMMLVIMMIMGMVKCILKWQHIRPDWMDCVIGYWEGEQKEDLKQCTDLIAVFTAL